MDRITKRRFRLFNQSPYCYWCHVELIWFDEPTPKNVPPNAATLDHLRSRLHPQRTEPNTKQVERTVLACYKCNGERGHREVQAVLTKEQQWERSGRYPIWWKLQQQEREMA